MGKPRAVVLLLAIAFLIAAASAANLYVGKNAEQARRIWTEQQLQTTKKQVEALEKERDELTKAKTELETRTSDLTKQAKAVAEQLAQERRAREALTSELAQMRKDSSQFKTQMDQERSDKQALTEDLSKAKQSYQALSNELTTLRQAKEALEKRVKEMLAQRAKEAEQIVVTNPAAGTPQAGTSPAPVSAVSTPGLKKSAEGKVLVVNREFHFVVVNLGSKDGVRKGTRFTVLRSNKPIMAVEVDKVYDNMASANMLDEEKKGWEVKEGDAVRSS